MPRLGTRARMPWLGRYYDNMVGQGAPIHAPIKGSVVVERLMTSGERYLRTVFKPVCPTIPGTTARYLRRRN